MGLVGGVCGRAFVQQAQGPEFRPQYHEKKKQGTGSHYQIFLEMC
jgi:hypothetical protein